MLDVPDLAWEDGVTLNDGFLVENNADCNNSFKHSSVHQ